MAAHGVDVPVASGQGHQPRPALEVGNPAVTQVDEMLDGQRQAVLVGRAHDVDLGMVDVPPEHDEGDLTRQQWFGDGRAEHHQGVETEVVERVQGTLLVAAARESAEHQVPPPLLRRGVEAVDQLEMEASGLAEEHPDELGFEARQRAGTHVGSVSQDLRGREHPPPACRAGPGGFAYHDGCKCRGDSGALGDVCERDTPPWARLLIVHVHSSVSRRCCVVQDATRSSFNAPWAESRTLYMGMPIAL